jgi:hypothetical protein
MPTREVLGYLDPGTGSFLIQLALAGLLGALFVIKTYWEKIKSWLFSLTGRSRGDGTER